MTMQSRRRGGTTGMSGKMTEDHIAEYVQMHIDSLRHVEDKKMAEQCKAMSDAYAYAALKFLERHENRNDTRQP